MEEEEGALPDHLRCKRTDGRQWRCKRRVMEGKKLCELHHIQGRHRQKRQKVPESLKMQRKKRVFEKNKLEIRAKLLQLAKPMKRKRVIGGESEALDESIRKMKLRRGDLPLELIRMVLKRENEKKKKKKRKESNCSDFDEEEEEDLIRELPNGLMAISSSSPHFDNAGSCSGSGTGSGSGSVSGSCFNVKVGETETDTVAITRRRFRSKNIEPLHVGTLQVMPYKKKVVNLRRGRRIRCHWCRKGGVPSLIKCSSCKQQFFCLDCIKEQYFVKREEVKIACPVCRGTCGCKACSVSQHRDTECKEFLRDKNKVDKVLYFHYLICMLLPVLKQINQDQSVEIEVEANIKGKKLSDIRVQPAEFGVNKQYCCNCKTFILDFHRSCPRCSYNLCLSCCRDIFRGSLVGSIKELNCKCPYRQKTGSPGIRLSDKKSVRISKKNHDSRYFDSSASLPTRKAPDCSVPISCPPTEFGGCGDGLLNLRCILPLKWFKELEINAEEIVGSYELPEVFDIFSCCPLCPGADYEAKGVKQLQEAAKRENSNDNFLFYPNIRNIHGDNLEHFQKHWGKGHPVIVRDVLKDTSDLSWDPIFLFCSYLKSGVAKSENEELAKATSCLDWFEVEIGIKQLFLGSLRGLAQSNMCDENLKLKGWLSSHLFQEQFPDHYAEIIRALPLPEYMDPRSGLLNIAARSPQGITKPDLGPCISISYSSGEELVQANLVTKICYSLCDVVNVLAHATDAPVSMKQLNKIRKLMKKKKSQDQRELPKTTLDQKMANKVKGKSSPHGENMEEVGLNDMISKEMHAHNRVPKVSSQFPPAAHEVHGLGFKDRAVYHDNEDSSDSGSDSDCNSNSEVAVLPFYTIHSSETSENQEVFGERTEFSKSCGAEWDVFRRQDVPKLMEYLSKHSNEFGHTCGFRKHVVHPILDQNFFLDKSHKTRLKDEYGELIKFCLSLVIVEDKFTEISFHLILLLEIEPWTFEQHVGEAVMVPAGCPYQIRNVKSCVNVVLDFVSPENVTECIQLMDELRLLPEDHKAKAEKFEVEKMALYRIRGAIKEIRELTCTE
ncbi:lysine-specific demethylase JMJ25-like isoform X2 [Durio zibethinus]|uniref:Lysine-specific demethylase JMJ25-like isoform X2 n=1 Tax=Durio zibethinus TaxID=66656 RepID=A0A6P5WWL3_DURZI|nr:lysine-specific demethylase JMJ25-like isoform X2 [Durio zibethinus]